MPHRTLVAVLAAGTFLAGCIVVPRTVEGYDRDCQVATHHMELDIVQLGRVNNCNWKQDCVAIVAGLAVTAASAVVSGSIVVVGNVVYWAERRAGCALATPVPAAPVPAAPVDSPAA